MPQVPEHCLSRPHPGQIPAGAKLAARVEQARAEQRAGTNPIGLIFPSPRGSHWRSSNFDRRVLEPAYRAAGWRDADGNGDWTWHSLRHVFCTTALFAWKLDATDASRMAGHANCWPANTGSCFPGGEPLPPETDVIGRGSRLHFLTDASWYQLTMDDIPG